MIKIFIIAGALILLFIILFLIKRKKKKQKEWMLFEKVEGYENDPKRSYFAIHKRTGIRKPAHPIDKDGKFKEPKEKIVEKIKIVPVGKNLIQIERRVEEGW